MRAHCTLAPCGHHGSGAPSRSSCSRAWPRPRRRRTGWSASGRWPASGSRRRWTGPSATGRSASSTRWSTRRCSTACAATSPSPRSSFIRERLDALMESWGGATLRVLRIPGAGTRAPAHASASTASPGSRDRARSACTRGRAPAPRSARRPPTTACSTRGCGRRGRIGVARVFAVWSGPPAANGERALHAELWEGRDRDRVTRAWSSATQWPDGLRVTDWRTQAGELVVRYEPRYPGWKPGCAEQFEHEDHYRLAAAGGLALARRQVANGWHRELGQRRGTPLPRAGRERRAAPWACSCPRPRCARGCRSASGPSRSASRRGRRARAGRSRWPPPSCATAGACRGRSRGRAGRPAGGSRPRAPC